MEEAPTFKGEKMQPTGVMTIPGWIPVDEKDGQQLLNGVWYAPMAGENSLNLAIGSAIKSYSAYVLNSILEEMKKKESGGMAIVQERLNEILVGNL